ncbi:S9 family peptidase [Pseudalkalibacillus caeni]|uniref:S9 family peptidase n=1 Tax=Exobacillus caeni TaxID=2574798 RepID=A0A5R9FDY4_9BACL|nr:S9 family peptidase [Pseudalkalibacillus caeni]TLS38774.1 S9 family peptidase [Pseudalkalibacillus caeni]
MRTIQKEDLYQMKFSGSPTISPDGKNIVYVLTEVSKEENGYSSSLYLHNGEQTRQLTYPYSAEKKLVKDHNPKWSPDGTYLAFLSNRTGKSQIWILPFSGGEAFQLTDLEDGVSDFNWSPDGTRLTFVGKVTEDRSANSDDKDEKEDEEKGYTVVTRLRYKGDGVGFYDGFSHLFIIELSSKAVTRITEGDFNHSGPLFSPTGDSIYYLANKDDDRELVDLNDIYRFDLGTKETKQIVEGKGFLLSPDLSPDGSYLAFVAHEEGEISSATTGVWIHNLSSGETTKLTKELDNPVGNYVGVDASYDTPLYQVKWTEDSKNVTFTATVGGNCWIYEVSLNGEIRRILPDENVVISSFDRVSTKLAFVKATPLSPGDVWVSENGETRQISSHNEELFAGISLSKPESFIYKGADGWDIEGWILPPVNRKENEKVPVVLQIHGGPHTAYGNALHHEFQLLAAEGYAVVYTNPRGSHGYGDLFVKACVGDWGIKDREDIIKGLDYALENYDYLDKEQQFITGGSYGGFMTNMVISQTDRFKAAVTQRCISNMYSFFGTSDIGFYFGSAQLGDVDLWEDEETIMKFSPIRYAKNVKTPTNIIHSEEDLRCPMEQAEQWYIALKRLGVDTRLIRFKGENHNLSRSGKPKNRIKRLEEITGWFNKYRA